MIGPIVFLDVDGVLTSCDEVPGSYLTHDKDEYGLSPSCLKVFKQILQKKNAKVVIISSWRKEKFNNFGEIDGEKIPNPLIPLKKEIGSKIIGFADASCSKVEAVGKWLDENDYDGEFVIIDDDDREHFQDEFAYGIAYHYYRTDTLTGLTDSDLNEVLKKFSGKED